MKAKAKVAKQEEKGARILYKNISSDQVVIMGFEGIMTEQEITEKYGTNIVNAYLCGSNNHYMLLRYMKDGELQLNTNMVMPLLRKGTILTNKDFSVLIADMKKCGKRLAEIIKANRENPVKEVRI